MKKIDNVAIIPARKGSVRIKNKSIRMIAGGKSLIIKKISINNKIYIPGNILKVKNTFVSKYKDLLLAKATLPKVDKMNFNNVHKIKQ